MIGMHRAVDPMCRNRITLLALLSCLIAPLRADEPKQQHSDLAQYDVLIKVDDRNHWAFQPVHRPALPSPPTDLSAATDHWVRNPVDAFVLAKLQSRDWQPAATAEPRQFLRRLYLDVT